LKILFSHYAIIDKEGFGRSFMLARELAVRGHEVTFLTTLPAARFVFPWMRELRDGVQIVAVPDLVPEFMRRTGFGVLSVLMRLVFVLFRRFDVYHADVGHRPSGGLALLLKKLFRPGLVYVSEWWDYFGRGGQYDDKRGIRRHTHGRFDLLTELPEKRVATGVVCLSEAMRKRGLGLGIRTPMEVVPGGADVQSIQFYPDTGVRARFGMDPEAVCFGFVGMNAGEVLDIEPFLEAFYALRREGRNLIWFTTGKPLDEAVRARYGVGDELTEFGWVDYADFAPVLSCADAFVMMQQQNLQNDTRWPNKIGDYLAAGRPVLTNLHGELRGVHARFPDLFVVAEWSAESVRQAMVRFMQDLEVDKLASDGSDSFVAASGSGASTSDRPQGAPPEAMAGSHVPVQGASTSGRPQAMYVSERLLVRRAYIRRIAEQELSWQRRAETLESFYRRLK
jgi:glycosyltransferase involved in cell wall biosynthesis